MRPGVPASSGDRCAAFRRICLRIWLVLVVGVSVIVPAAGINSLKVIPLHTDFITFYAVGTLARADRSGEAYDDRVLSDAVSSVVGEPIVGLHWLYPPGMVLVTWPLAIFSPFSAYLLWIGIGLGCLGWALWRLAPQPASLLLLPLCPAVIYCVMTGQVSLFAAALAGGGFICLARRPALAGILFGILTLKIQLALLLPVCLIAGRHYRALAFMCAAAILAQVGGLALAGWGSVPAFLQAASGDLAFVADRPNLLARIPTVYSLLIGLSASQPLALAIQSLSSLTVAAILWYVWRRSEDVVARSLSWSAGALLAAPYVFDYDLAIFVIPLAAIAWRCRDRDVDATQAAIMTVLWSAAFALKYMAAAVGLQIGPLIAAALLAYAVASARHPLNPNAGILAERTGLD